MTCSHASPDGASGIHTLYNAKQSCNKTAGHTVMAELIVPESKGQFFSHWKQAITEPLSILTMELYDTEVKKPFASTVEHSRQQTFASCLQEIRKKGIHAREGGCRCNCSSAECVQLPGCRFCNLGLCETRSMRCGQRITKNESECIHGDR